MSWHKASTFLTMTGQELLRGVPVDWLNTHRPFSNMEEPVSSVPHWSCVCVCRSSSLSSIDQPAISVQTTHVSAGWDKLWLLLTERWCRREGLGGAWRDADSGGGQERKSHSPRASRTHWDTHTHVCMCVTYIYTHTLTYSCMHTSTAKWGALTKAKQPEWNTALGSRTSLMCPCSMTVTVNML